MMAAGKHVYSFLEKRQPMTITQHIMLGSGGHALIPVNSMTSARQTQSGLC